MRDLVASLGPEGGAAVRVVADMVTTADGRATVGGTSVALGHPADRALLRELRAQSDAILVGTGTLAAERYARLLDDEQRAWRVARGLPEHPIVATVSRALRLPVAEAPVFEEAGVPIVAFTESEAPPPAAGAELSVVRFAAGTLSLRRCLDALAERGARRVLCEGGPSLLRRLVGEGALDDLLMTVAPLLAAGDAPAILEGDALTPDPPRLELREAHRADDHLFLHYGLRR